MSAIGRLKTGFAGAVAATALFAAPACAQEDQSANVTPVSMVTSEAASTNTSTVEFLSDADTASSDWVVENPDGLAVSIRYGGATEYSPELIERTLRNDLSSFGFSNVAFFWERGSEQGGSSIIYEVIGRGFGPFGLTDGRRQISQIAQSLEFDPAIRTASMN
jgi:hypothetical protein